MRKITTSKYEDDIYKYEQECNDLSTIEFDRGLNNMSDKCMTLVGDLLDRADYLSEWENSFVASIDEQLLADRTLTAKQIDKLKQLHEKYVLGW